MTKTTMTMLKEEKEAAIEEEEDGGGTRRSIPHLLHTHTHTHTHQSFNLTNQFQGETVETVTMCHGKTKEYLAEIPTEVAQCPEKQMKLKWLGVNARVECSLLL